MTPTFLIARAGSPPQQDQNAASRWASLIIRAIDCPNDPRNLTAWGRFVGASVPTLRARCAAIDTSTKASLDFARLLRVIVIANGSTWDPSVQLDVHDLRTLRRLLNDGGIARLPAGVAAPPLGHFFDRQRLVHHEYTLSCVARALMGRGLL